MHAAGQLIYTESGHGRYQIKGQPIRKLAPATPATFRPARCTGTGPNESFAMTFVTMGAGATTPGESITDEIYLVKK